jgi:hypothetical protein
MERSQEKQELHKREIIDTDFISSSTAVGILEYSSVGKTFATTSTSSSNNRRLITSSSLSSPAKEQEKPEFESDEDLRHQEMSTIRKPIVTVNLQGEPRYTQPRYSEIDEDLECGNHKEENESSIDIELVKLEEKVLEEDLEEGIQDGQAQIGGFSRVELYSEDKQLEQEVGIIVDRPKAELSADLGNSPVLPQSSRIEETDVLSSSEDDGILLQIDWDDEQVKDEDFGLAIAEAEKHIETLHSSVASSECNQENDEVIRKAEESVLQGENQVVETDTSLTDQLDPEDIVEEERQCVVEMKKVASRDVREKKTGGEKVLRESKRGSWDFKRAPKYIAEPDLRRGQLDPKEVAEQDRQCVVEIENVASQDVQEKKTGKERVERESKTGKWDFKRAPKHSISAEPDQRPKKKHRHH